MRRRTFLGGTLAAFASRPFGHAFAASGVADGRGRHELVARPSTEPPVGMPLPADTGLIVRRRCARPRDPATPR